MVVSVGLMAGGLKQKTACALKVLRKILLQQALLQKPSQARAYQCGLAALESWGGGGGKGEEWWWWPAGWMDGLSAMMPQRLTIMLARQHWQGLSHDDYA